MILRALFVVIYYVSFLHLAYGEDILEGQKMLNLPGKPGHIWLTPKRSTFRGVNRIWPVFIGVQQKLNYLTFEDTCREACSPEILLSYSYKLMGLLSVTRSLTLTSMT